MNKETVKARYPEEQKREEKTGWSLYVLFLLTIFFLFFLGWFGWRLDEVWMNANQLAK